MNGTLYYYRVLAIDQVGGITGVPTEPSMTATSAPSNVVKHPTNLHYLTVISPHGTVVKSPDQPSYINGDRHRFDGNGIFGLDLYQLDW